MPLSDSFSAGSSPVIRLPKMNSVPQTEDLKYALGEAKKNPKKAIVLPFDHPTSGIAFCVKVMIGQGTQPPRWSLERGDGPGAVVMWTRDSAEVLMIQNKIKTESGGFFDDGQQQPQLQSTTSHFSVPTEQTISGRFSTAEMGLVDTREQQPDEFQGAADGGGGFQNFTGQIDFPEAQLPPEPPDPHFEPVEQYSLPSSGPPRSPTASQQKISPFGVPTNTTAERQILIPPTPLPFAPFDQMPSTPAQTQRKKEDEAALQQAQAQAQAEEKRRAQEALQAKLPPPFEFDRQATNVVYSLLVEPTGLMSFNAFVFFLFREFARFQKDESPLAVVVFELAIRRQNQIFLLPPDGISRVAERIRPCCSPLDVVAHLNGSQFIALLCSATGTEALTYCENVYQTLSDGPLLPGAEGSETLTAFGAASIPETCQHPGVVVSAAMAIKEEAKRRQPPYMLFS